MQLRGGIPQIRSSVTIPAAHNDYTSLLPFKGLSVRVVIKNTGANAILLALSRDDSDNAENQWSIPAGETFDLPIEVNGLWAYGDGGATTADIIWIFRKG